MRHPPETRHKVRSSYVVQRLTLAEAARRAGIPERTARTWKREAGAAGDDWDRARTAQNMAEGGLGSVTERMLEDFSTLFANTTAALHSREGDPIETGSAMAGLADAYAKVVKAAGCVDPRLSRLAIAMETLKRLGRHVRERGDPASVNALAGLLESFGEELAADWG